MKINKVKKLDQNSKILNLTHYDLDGLSCSIVLKNYFKNVVFIAENYTTLAYTINKLKDKTYKSIYDYDAVFITDIYPEKDISVLDDLDNIIMLDHHAVNSLHDPNNSMYVIDNKCGALLTKLFIEKTFNVDLSYLDKFISIVNDYDLWIHEYKKSKCVNEIFYKLGHQAFINRFIKGDIKFTNDEKLFLIDRNNKLKMAWDELELIELDNINGCFFYAFEFVNDLADRAMKDENFDIVFIKTKNTISVRTSLDNIDLGKLFKEMGIGGGHAKAAGINITSTDIYYIEINIKVVVNELNKKYPELNKKIKNL